MKIFPAIDIRNGKCVRLIKGNYDEEIVFDEDPVSVALNFEKLGSKYVHIIDLDGAKEGKSIIINQVVKILNKTNLKIQIGGGIRNYKTAESLINIGVEKIIFGTAALEHKSEVIKSIKSFGSKIVVSIDALKGKIKTKGWLKNSEIPIKSLVEELEFIGCKNFIYTDIEKDGTMNHPNFDFISEFRKFCNTELYIAGGISNIKDIMELKNIGVDGAILGMSIYTGNIDLKTLLGKI